MKKLLVLMLVLATFLGCIVGDAEKLRVNQPNFDSKEELVEILDNGTIALLSLNDENKYRITCSGVWITQYEVISAFHCISDNVLPTIVVVDDQLFFIDPDESLYLGQVVPYVSSKNLKGKKERKLGVNVDPSDVSFAIVVATDRKNDLVMFKTLNENDAFEHSTLPIRDKRIKIRAGEDLLIMGHTAGYPFTFLTGTVSAERYENSPMGELAHVIQASVPAWYGNSGGGAFDDHGNLVGIASFMRTNVPNMTFFIHFKEINSFVEKNQKQLSRPR